MLCAIRIQEEDKVNTQQQRFIDTRGFRLVVLAALAVALMVGAAYWFGTRLQADTSASVARSPLGSSLTAIRESRLDDYYGRYSAAAAAVRLTVLAGSRLDDYYARFSDASTAAKLAAMAGSRLDDYYGRLFQTATADNRTEDYYFRMNR
jgi:predicted negative regulator of RcsB-dependent stress response